MMLYLLKISVLFLLFSAGCGGNDHDGRDVPRNEQPTKETKGAETVEAPLSAKSRDAVKAILGGRDEATAIQPVGRDALAYFGDLGIPKVSEIEPRLKASLSPQSVILIVIDTLTARHLSIYGYARRTSPNIDKLAKAGLLFNNYVSNSSWTRPSYTTIITGLPKSRHKVELGGSLKMDTTTLAERFRRKGYLTAAFVGNPLVREIWGFGQGYQTYKDTHSYQKVFPFDGLLVDDALTWLDKIGDERHFTTLFMTSPHAPYRPPRERRSFLKTVAAGPINEFPFREYKAPLRKGEHDRIVAAYDDEVAYADYQVGRILNYLKKKNQDEKTAVVVTADHGELLGEHNCYGHGYHMWEQNLRVPLVIRSSNLTVAGHLDDSPHTHIDLAPSLMTLAGIDERPADLTGISLFDTSQAEHRRIRTSMYNAHDIRRQAVRDNRYKLVHYNKIDEAALQKLNSLSGQIPHADPFDLPSLTATLNGEKYALYDLHEDPKETTDIFDTHKDDPAVRRLLEEVLKYVTDEDEEVGKMSNELIEALKNAGYFVEDDD